MTDRIQIPRLALVAGSILSIWILASLVGTGLETIRLLTFGAAGSSLGLEETVILGLMRGVFWALLTPLIVYVAARWPVRKPHRMRRALLMIGWTILFALAREALGTLWIQMIGAQSINFDEVMAAWTLRLDINIAAVVVVIAVVNVLSYQRETSLRLRREAELETQIQQAQLRQLRSDLHPHFLFNALHGIAALIHTDPDAADRMLMHLSGLLQRALELRRAASIPLGDELSIAHDFLELARMRFGDRLSFSVDADEASLACAVPPLLLQPLVENAIKHGAVSEGLVGRIDVRAYARDERLTLEVRDNGPGVDALPDGSNGGTGVANVRERLRLIFGDRAQMTMSRQDGGFLVSLHLPSRGGPSPSMY